MTRFAVANCNNFLTPERAVKASKGHRRSFELHELYSSFQSLVYRLDRSIDVFIKKSRKQKRFDKHVYKLRTPQCRTGCDSARQQSIHNLKTVQFFLRPQWRALPAQSRINISQCFLYASSIVEFYSAIKKHSSVKKEKTN